LNRSRPARVFRIDAHGAATRVARQRRHLRGTSGAALPARRPGGFGGAGPRLGKRLLYFIRRLVKNEQDAWDILQQTWLRVLPGIRALKDPQRLTPWLYQVARNTAFNHARLQAVYRAGLEEHADADLPDEDAAVVEFDHAEEVHAALEQLSLPHREVLTLYFLEDLTIAEIAGVIGVQPGTVKSRLFYARRALRDILQKESARHE
jgi:RNA polymerase sigma factor (sigma-70 family)